MVLIMFGCEICATDADLRVIDAGVGYLATDPERDAA
jgi:hypothetical protein